MRVDGVEIKVTLEVGRTRSALQALELPDRPQWRICSCEDAPAGTSPGTPLLDLGVTCAPVASRTGKTTRR
jgi:hypothetical protein